MAISAPAEKAPVGVSQCLLGEPVRYDGGHKYDPQVSELGAYFAYRPICPEVAIGLGVPRQPIRLVSSDGDTRVLGVENSTLDVTAALAAEADRVADAMADLSGYIFMQNSPSCGVHGVKRYSPQGQLLVSSDENNVGQGEFARRLIQRKPLLPVVEAQQLSNGALRESFVARVLARHDWQRCLESDPSPDRLVAFYARYKARIMARHPASGELIDRLLAGVNADNIQPLNREFLALLMSALGHPAPPSV